MILNIFGNSRNDTIETKQVNLSLTAVNENTENRQNRDIVKCEKIRALFKKKVKNKRGQGIDRFLF